MKFEDRYNALRNNKETTIEDVLKLLDYAAVLMGKKNERIVELETENNQSYYYMGRLQNDLEKAENTISVLEAENRRLLEKPEIN